MGERREIHSSAGDHSVDHVQHDEDEKQAGGPACSRASLLGELRDQERQAAEHGADQCEVQAEEQAVTKAEVGAKLLAARERDQPDQNANHQQRRPHRRQLLQRDAQPGPRQREEHVHGAAVLLAAQHPAARQERPDCDQEDENADLECRIATDRVDGDCVGIPGERGREADQLLSCLRRRDQRGHARHGRNHDQSHPDAPAEDRDPVVAQGLEEDALKPHRWSPWRARRPLRSSAGRCPRGSARSW